MEERIIRVNGCDYIIRVEEYNVFIGTPGVVSRIGGQLMAHKVMESLKWEPTRTFLDLHLKGRSCIGVGYKIPYFIRLFHKPMEYIIQNI